MTKELIKALDEEIAAELSKRSSEFVKADDFSAEEVDESQPLLSNYILSNRYSRWHSCVIDNRKYHKVKIEILSNITERLILDDNSGMSSDALCYLCEKKREMDSVLKQLDHDDAWIKSYRR